MTTSLLKCVLPAMALCGAIGVASPAWSDVRPENGGAPLQLAQADIPATQGDAETEDSCADGRIFMMLNSSEQVCAIAEITANAGAGTTRGFAGAVIDEELDSSQVNPVDVEKTFDADSQVELAGLLAANPWGLIALQDFIAGHADLAAVLDRESIEIADVVGIQSNENGVLDVYYSEALFLTSCATIEPAGAAASRDAVMSAKSAFLIALSDCDRLGEGISLGGEISAVAENDALSEDLAARGFSPSDVVGVRVQGEHIVIYVASTLGM